MSNKPVELIVSEPNGREYKDLRDRAAYMFITGCLPTHLRREANERLLLIGSLSEGPTSLDGCSGGLQILDHAVLQLNLEDHPMVKKVRTFLADGYRITVSPTSNTRRSYKRIFLSRREGDQDRQITVKWDGSILGHW